MILLARQAQAAIAGRATQTRVLTHPNRPCPVKVGHDYPIRPGVKRPSIGRIKILTVRDTVLGDITYTDARAEGYKTTIVLKVDWIIHHDTDYYTTHTDADDHDLTARFDTRYAHKPVHVITFTTAPDRPLLLATQGAILAGHCIDGGYTTNHAKAIDDLEVIPPAARYVEHAYAEGERARKAQRDARGEPRRRKKAVRDRARVASWQVGV